MRVTLERTGCEAELCQDGAVEGPASSLSSAFSSAQEKFIPRSSPIAPKRRCARSFGARIDPQSVLCSDGWPGYDGLVDVGYDKHVRINKQKSFTNGHAHINGIEAFWSFTKRRLAKFNGVKTNFELHLKECEWRYNKSSSFLIQNLLSLIRNPGNLLV